jgi:uncharacterized tellurite resistance protein B-like protein
MSYLIRRLIMDELKVPAAILLARIMGTDQTLIDTESDPGKELGEPNFNLEKVADRYWEIYKLLSEKAAA